MTESYDVNLIISYCKLDQALVHNKKGMIIRNRTTKIFGHPHKVASVILQHGTDDFICLTDMARYKDNDPAFIIGHWLRLRNTIEYMGTWETLHNPNFKPTDFGRFLSESGSPFQSQLYRPYRCN